MIFFSNEIGHITKILAMLLYGKNNSLKSFYSRTNRAIAIELCMLH